MNRVDLINFYKDNLYNDNSIRERGVPPRPNEFNLPIVINRHINSDPSFFDNSINNGKIEHIVEDESLEFIKTIILHESLFTFYKSFYNYLCALKLHQGDFLHWINITSYYTKFYLAKTLLTLTTGTIYKINEGDHLFNDLIFNKLISKNNKKKYQINLNLNIKENSGNIKISSKFDGSSSHRYVFNNYSKINFEEIGITEIIFPENYQYLINQRNQENYSFDGYKQLLYNATFDSFKAYYPRDKHYSQADMIYTENTAIDIHIFGQIYKLYSELNIKNFPIEKEKLIFMVNHSLGESIQTEKLIKLIETDFEEPNDFIDEFNSYINS